MGKACVKCGQHKPLDEFHRYHRSKDGVRSRCKECTSQECKQRRSNGAGWTAESIKDLEAAYDKHVGLGKSGMRLANAISNEIGRTPYSVKRAVAVHLNRTLKPGKASVQKLDHVPKKMEPVPPVAMIDGIEVTDFGSFDVWKKAVEKLREMGRNAKVKDGSCYLDGKTVTLMEFCKEAKVELSW